MNHNSSLSNTTLTLTLLLSVIITALSFQGKTDWLTPPINLIFTPLRLPFLSTRNTLNSLHRQISTIPHQQRIIKDLERQNQELAFLAHNSQELQKENQFLRDLKDLALPSDHHYLTARIIGFARFATLNVGAKDGIKTGSAVTDGQSLVGIIKNVSPITSSLRTIKDLETNLQVTTLSGQTGALTFNGSDLIIESNSNINFKQNDPLFTRGNDNLVPEGLLVGKIKSNISTESTSTKQALVEATTDINQLNHVLVLSPQE